MADTTQKTNLIARTLFIVGGLILFIVLIVFIFKLVPKVISGIGSLFNIESKSNETIIIKTNPEIAEHGVPLMTTFEYRPTEPGQYFISYTCVDGLFFDIQSANGPQRIVCNTPFKLGSSITQIALTPLLTGNQTFVDTTFKVEYKNSKNIVVDSGTKIISVGTEEGSQTNNGDNPFNVKGPLAGSTVTTTDIPPTNNRPATTQPVTNTNTTIRPVANVPATRDLTITNIYPIANQSAFVMHVYNYGNTATGPWEFAYTDAENPSRTVTSPVQASLAGGQGLAISVRFDGQANSSQTVRVTVNPFNQIAETNTTNNSASVILTGSRSNSNDDSFNSDDDADLVITSIEVGRMSGNRFVERNTIDKDDTGAIVFTVTNQGGESTGSWRYEIDNLPYSSSSDRTYRSSNQSSLRPGEYREFIVEFDGMRTGTFDIEVFVDSEDDVDEERENNNRRSKELEVEN